MKKSLWVSFCGWAVVGCFGFLVGAFVVFIRYRPGPYPIPPVLWSLAFLLSFPFFILWALGSIVHRVRVGTAKMHAAAMIEAQTKAGVSPLAALSALKRPPLVGAAGGQCALCVVRPAVVRRVADGMLLCSVCLQAETGKAASAGGDSAAAGA
jgi:hypothetical protein